MSTTLGMTDAPSAVRAVRPGWRDPRLWVGVALVAISVLVGVRLVGGADETIEVWAAGSDLAAGQPIAESDLVAQRVGFADAADAEAYLRVGDELPDDAVLARAVGSGELLPAAALGAQEDGLVEVPIHTSAVPAGVVPGAVVDVWVTPPTGEGAAARPVLSDVTVLAVEQPDDSFGSAGLRQVVVGVADAPDAEVGRVLAAARDDRVSFTRKG